MAEVGAIIVNARMYTAEFSRGSAKVRQELKGVNEMVDAGSRSLKAYYQTLSRRTDRGIFEQRVRDEMAAQIKAMREATQAANVMAEAQKRLFGGDPAAAAPVRRSAILSHYVPSVDDIEQAIQASASAIETAGADPDGTGAVGTALAETTVRGFLDQLKAQFGKSSTIGKIGSVLKGGGAIAGLALGGRVFASAAEKAKEVAEHWEEAHFWWEKMWAAGKAVPVLGTIQKGAEDLLKVITGAAAEAGRLAKEMERVAAANAAIKSARQGTENIVGDLERDLDLAEAPDDEAREHLEINNRFGERLARIGQMVEEQRKLIEEYEKLKALGLGATDEEAAKRRQLADEINRLQEDIGHAEKIANDLRAQELENAERQRHEQRLDQIAREQDEAMRAQQELDEAARRAEQERQDEVIAAADEAVRKWQEAADREQEAMEADAERVRDSIRTARERFQEEVERIGRLLERGLLTEDEAAQALLKARGDSEVRSPEGRERRFTFRSASAPLPVRDPLVEEAKKQLGIMTAVRDNTAPLLRLNGVPVFEIEN